MISRRIVGAEGPRILAPPAAVVLPTGVPPSQLIEMPPTPAEVFRALQGASPEIRLGEIALRARDFASPVGALPPRGSVAWKAAVTSIRAGLDPLAGPGYLTLDTSHFFPEARAELLHASLPPACQVNLAKGVVLGIGGVEHPPFPEVPRRAFNRYVRWIEHVLSESLGKPAKAQASEVRTWSAAALGEGLRFDDWHIDGGDLAVLVTLKGTPTELLLGTPKLDHFSGDWDAVRSRTDATSTPLRHTLIFSCSERGKRFAEVFPTVHRSPHDMLDRLLLLIRVKIAA